MKVRLNKLPVKTTNGFQINDVEVDLELPLFQYQRDVQWSGDYSSLVIRKEFKKESMHSKIGLEVSSYYDIAIQIPRDTKIEEPISITFELEEEDAFYGKLHLDYFENSSCNFRITVKSKDEKKHVYYLMESVSSKENSNGNITILNQMNSSSVVLYALENDVLDQASITHTILDLGGKARLYNVSSRAFGKESKNVLNTIYVGKEDSLLDFNYYLKNIGEESNHLMRVEGLLDDNSCKNFRGTIDFVKGCRRSVGEESENCILLSDTCRSRSLPQMLCGEEDVVGSHGVASGKVDEDKMFYLMSRGHQEKEAEKLIVMGRFEKILSDIPSSFREEISSLIEALFS